MPTTKTRVITLRLPEPLYERIKRAAAVSGLSMNFICLNGAETAVEELEAYHEIRTEPEPTGART